MTSRMLVFTPHGDALGELSVPVFRAWAMNKVAEAEFEISTNDAGATPELLNVGNLLLIQHDTLPDWVGVLDTPMEWDAHKVKCKAYSAEVIMDWRYTPLVHIEISPAPDFFKMALELMNSYFAEGISIEAGEIASRATLIYLQGIRWSTLLEKLSIKNGFEWNITGKLEAGRLRLFLNVYDYMGITTFQVLDNSNTELSTPVITDSGTVYNYVVVYSQGASGGARNYATATDPESIAQFGLRVTAEEQKGSGTDEAGLQIAADYILYNYRQPHSKISPTVLNIGDTFRHLRLGNVVQWRTATTTFTGKLLGKQAAARILGMEYNEVADKVTLVADLDYNELTKKQFLAQWRANYGRRI